MSASWFMMFFHVEDLWSLATVTIVCTFLTFVEATSSFKMFQKTKIISEWVTCYPRHLVGNNFYLNVINNHCNVNRQQVCHAVCLWQRHSSFYVYFCFKTFFVYALFFLSLSLYKRCLTVHFTYQGCSTAFVQVWMNVCMYQSVCVIIIKTATGFSFQHAVEFD